MATVLLMTLSVGPATAQQVPTPPATFWGSVRMDGQSVPDGTQVLALIGDKTCGEAEKQPGQKGTWTTSEDEPKYGIRAGDSLYAVDVASDSQTPACGTEGATVTFLVAGKPAHQKGVWKAGPNPLSLTDESGSGGSFTWWPALAGGTAGLIAVVGLGLWWRARTAARKKVT